MFFDGLRRNAPQRFPLFALFAAHQLTGRALAAAFAVTCGEVATQLRLTSPLSSGRRYRSIADRHNLRDRHP